MKILVLKFGGISLSTTENRKMAANKIMEARKTGYTPVVVISANGITTTPCATDNLIKMVKSECESIGQREIDMMISCGEMIGGLMLTATLKSLGMDTVLLNWQQAGIVTTAKHGDAQILCVRTGNIVHNAEQGKIVVVTGLQGVSEYGEITTLGRGGGDTAAVAIGAALGAKAVDIYTDVDGIVTADPQIVPSAKIIPAIAFEEAYQMASLGSQVLHSRVIETAMRHNLPLTVRSLFNDGKGTSISNRVDGTTEILGNSSAVGIVCRAGYGLLRLYSEDTSNYGYTSALFRGLADLGAERDFISIAPNYIDVIVDQSIIEAVQALGEENGVKTKEVLPDCAKISLVVSQRTVDPGVFSNFVEILRNKKIYIFRTYTGPFAISAVVARNNADVAVNSLHAKLFETKQNLKLNFMLNLDTKAQTGVVI